MSEPLLFGDCHTHVDQYDSAELPGLLERAAEVGVASVILAGTTLESTRACIGLAGEFDAFYAGVGIHPCQAYERVDDAMYAELERLAAVAEGGVHQRGGAGLPAGVAGPLGAGPGVP